MINMKTNDMIAALRSEGAPSSDMIADRLEEMLIANKSLEARLAQARADKRAYRKRYEELLHAVRNLWYNFRDTE
jgi:hypothetical protein